MYRYFRKTAGYRINWQSSFLWVWITIYALHQERRNVSSSCGALMVGIIILEEPLVIPRLELPVHRILWNLCVNLGGLQGNMPKKVFYYYERNPSFKHVGGRGMPHWMGRILVPELIRLFAFCLGNVFCKDLFDAWDGLFWSSIFVTLVA